MPRNMRWIALAIVAVAILAFEVHMEWSHRTAEGRDLGIKALHDEMAVRLADDDAMVTASLAARHPFTLGVPDDATDTASNWRELFETWESRRQDETARSQWGEVRDLLHTAEERRDLGLFEGDQLALLDASVATHADIVDGVISLTQRGAAFPSVTSPSEEKELCGRLTELSELLDADAVLRTKTGAYDRAIERVTAKTALTEGSRFLQYPGTRLTLQVVDNALCRSSTSAPCWDGFLTQLADSRGHERFVKQMARNSASVVDRYARFPMSQDKELAEDPVGFLERWTYRYPGAPVYNQHLNTFSRSMTEMLQLASRPYHEVKARVEELAASLPPDGTLLARRCHWVSALRANAEGFARQAYHEANIDLTMLAIQLQRYRATYGVYPEALEDLADYLGAAVPTDPLSGRSYRYERSGASYRLYALGPKAQPGTDARVFWPGSV